MAGGYPDLVAPIVPDSQKNKSPEIFLQAMGTGLQAAARFAEMRRQSELEIQKMALTEKLAQDQHAVEREKIYKDASAQEELMKLHGQYYDSLGKAAIMKAEAYTKGMGNTIEFNQKKQELLDDVQAQASDLKLDDPKFATDKPVQYAANILKFEDMFRMSPLADVKAQIKQYRTIADQQKIPLKTSVVDADGKLTATGEAKMVPIWQIVKHMKDPLFQDQTLQDLEASGHLNMVEEFQTIGGKKVPNKKTEPKPYLKGQLEEGKDVKFESAPNRVPGAMMQHSAFKGADLPAPDVPEDTTTNPPDASAAPASSATPDYQPTETDNFLGMAKAAIAKGAPMNAVAAKLQELGIDPQALFAA